MEIFKQKSEIEQQREMEICKQQSDDYQIPVTQLKGPGEMEICKQQSGTEEWRYASSKARLK